MVSVIIIMTVEAVADRQIAGGVHLNYINVLHMSKHTIALLEQKY